MNQSIHRRISAHYDLLRQEAVTRRDTILADAYQRFPELVQLDRDIAAAGADMLMEAIDPTREKTAGARKKAFQNRKSDFLEAKGLPRDLGEIIYTCNKCSDTGFHGSIRCSCYQSKLIPLLFESANLNQLKDISFTSFDEQLYSDQPDQKRYQSELSPRMQIRGIRQACERFVNEFDHPETRNMLFVGKPGTGKTFLMACIAHALIEEGRTVLYLQAAQMFDALAEYRVLSTSFHPDEIRYEKSCALQDAILHCELLFIDDLGTEYTSAARYPELLQVLDQRSGPGSRTVLSSNVEAGLMRELYDERLLSRLYGGFAVYRFIGEDVRFILNQRRRQARV
jgi:DNA replication protein DnaC